MSRAILSRLVLPSLLMATLSACGEKEQSQASERRSSDAKSWQGTNNPYVVKGWSAGDKASWEGQLKARAQSQNEYVRVN